MADIHCWTEPRFPNINKLKLFFVSIDKSKWRFDSSVPKLGIEELCVIGKILRETEEDFLIRLILPAMLNWGSMATTPTVYYSFRKTGEIWFYDYDIQQNPEKIFEIKPKSVISCVSKWKSPKDIYIICSKCKNKINTEEKRFNLDQYISFKNFYYECIVCCRKENCFIKHKVPSLLSLCLKTIDDYKLI